MGEPGHFKTRFGVFELDTRSGELRKAGTRIRLQDQPLKVLIALLERPGEVVTREELKRQIWPEDSFGDFDHAVNVAVAKLRTALGDSADNPVFIETLPRRGYRLMAPVTVNDGKGLATVGDRVAASPARPLRFWRRAPWGVAAILALALIAALVWQFAPSFRRHSSALGAPKTVAVIEIENLSQDPSLNWLGNGLVDLLTTDLAQAKSFDVISTERIRSLIEREVKQGEQLPPGEAQRVAREAHADRFISGAVLKVGQGIYLDLRVQDTATGKVILAEKVEGDSLQAIFLMADRATARIISELLPAGALVQPNSATSLTSNLDALHVYEQGVSYQGRLLMDQAAVSFRQATEFDPQFTMAYYRLFATLNLNKTDVLEARRAVNRAAELAQTRPLTEQQRSMIRAAQLFADGRNEDGIQLLDTAAKQFPKEAQLWFALGLNLHKAGKTQEATAVFENIAQIDPNYAPTYNILAYNYAFQGDLARAITAIDRYASLLPVDDPNPIDTRGDVYALSGRFDDALAQYEKNIALNSPLFGRMSEVKISLVYLHEGKYALAEKVAQSGYDKSSGINRALVTSVLGDIAVGQGRLDRAVSYYEQAARLNLRGSPVAELGLLLKAAEIYFEQDEPQAALAFARRQPALWGHGIQAMALLLLKDKTAAEKEFSAERAAAAPLIGDYGAGRIITLERFFVADNAGNWQELISGGPTLVSRQNALVVHLHLGHAYLETGMPLQAERELRLTLLRARDWGLSDIIAGRSFLDTILADFYLGKALEKEGKKADAISAYQEFLNHFENSTARLAQIHEARAALRRLR